MCLGPATEKSRACDGSFFQSSRIYKIDIFPEIRRVAKMRACHMPVVLATPPARLRNRHHAHSGAGRSVSGRDKVASPTLPAVPDHFATTAFARVGPRGAKRSRRIR